MSSQNHTRIKTKLKKLIVRHNTNKQEAEHYFDMAKESRDEIQSLMVSNGIEKIDVELDDGSLLTATVASGRTTTMVDVEMLKDKVSPAILKRVTKSVINMDAFRDAIARGDIPIDVAEEVTTTRVGDAYMVLPGPKFPKS